MLDGRSVRCRARSGVGRSERVFDEEHRVAMIERRSRVDRPARGKRLVRGLPPLAAWGRTMRAAMAAGIVCALAAGCDGGHDDADARLHAADTTPMLPGTRGAATQAARVGAQRFDTSDGTHAHAASDALLPPVMHTAD
jgi:hypothetical protein